MTKAGVCAIISSVGARVPTKKNMGAFPSGQRGQTVNLLSLTSVVRIHPLPPIQKAGHRPAFCIGESGWQEQPERKRINTFIPTVHIPRLLATAPAVVCGHESTRSHQNKKHFVRSAFCFRTMCSASAEREAHFVRDVSFGSDVRFAREDAEHITSLCARGTIHHCALALHHYGGAITSLFTNNKICAMM